MVRVLIIGTGGMAAFHAKQLAIHEDATVVGGVDPDEVRLVTFCDTHKLDKAFTSLDDALAWGEFDAVSNVTPDAAHCTTTLACLDAGKHVFCEKPLATNHKDAMRMVERAEATDRVAMVNLTYRNLNVIQKARDIIRAGSIGEVRHLEASYLQSWLVQPAWGDWRTESQWLWRLSKAHGSMGVLGDVGIHIFDFATFAADLDVTHVSARLKTFHKASGDRIKDYTLDANDSFTSNVTLANGAVGVVHATRWATGHFNDLFLRVYGERGGLEINARHEKKPVLRLCEGDDLRRAEWRTVDCPKVPTNIERFVAAVAEGKNDEPSFARAARLQKVIDACVESDERNQAIAL